MPNGGEYIIDSIISEGGFSLVYSVHTKGTTKSLAMKEFFPVGLAFRNDQGFPQPHEGCEARYNTYLGNFEREGIIGSRASQKSFQTITFQQCSKGYALMQHESEDMRSIADLVHFWQVHPPVAYTGYSTDEDPWFTDLVRVSYALRISESLLAVLSSIHQQGYLHLDISATNVIWAGQDQSTGRNCVAFLADFGCSTPMNSDGNHVTLLNSYSPGFAAPELKHRNSICTRATDLYSVGMLLFYVCCPESALEITRNMKHKIKREIGRLRIPASTRNHLQSIIERATAELPDRYQIAELMQKDVRLLLDSIPKRPINPTKTSGFTLYSLKSMVLGCPGEKYSWADELCDRLNKRRQDITVNLIDGLTWKDMNDDTDFLKNLFSEEIYNYLMDRINEHHDKESIIKAIMSGNYDTSWRNEICRFSKRYGLRRLIQSCQALLDNEEQFFIDIDVLFQLLGPDGSYLNKCFLRCDIRNYPYIGLAMISMYALLGKEGFESLIRSESESTITFHRV